MFWQSVAEDELDYQCAGMCDDPADQTDKRDVEEIPF